MALNPKIIDRVKEEQKRVFRIALDPMRYGLTLKAIAIDSNLGYDALRTWARGESVMPITALYALCDVLPDELLSLLLPAQFFITRKSDGVNLADLAGRALDYVGTYTAARSPDSEAGVELGPNETAILNDKANRLQT